MNPPRRGFVDRRVRPLVLTGCAACLWPAQATAQDHPVWSRQQPDGRWSASDDGTPAEGDLRVTSLMLLGLVGDGSTTRTGAGRPFLREGLRWLRSRQDAHGRFGLRADPHWLLDHAIATCAFAEVARTSPHATLAVELRRAVEALRVAIAKARPAVPVETRLWCAMTVRSLRAAATALRADGAADARLAADGAHVLERALAGLAPAPAAETARERAARVLQDVLAGRELDAEAALAVLAQPMQEPLAAFYAAAACWCSGGGAWTAAGRRIQEQVLTSEVAQGDQRGTWDPDPESGAFHGRLGTTATAILILELYYRYCRLAVFGE